jgi:phosphonate transport system substrate-binding protein
MRSLPAPWLGALLLATVACDATPFRVADVDVAAVLDEGERRSAEAAPTLRFSVAAVESPRDTYAAYSRLVERIGNRLGTEVELVQRRTYREVNDLLASGRLDVALVCTGGYLDLLARAPGAVELLAVPQVDGASTYQSLIVVPSRSPAQKIEDLEGKRFAFTDELSLSGRTYLVRYLQDLGRDPKRFFSSITYTRSHDRSIQATARGLVDGAAVHSIVYAHMLERDPRLATRLRVIQRSPPFGMMPVVVSTRLPPDARERLRRVLVDLALDPEGVAVLEALQVESFGPAPAGLFDSALVVVGAPR